MASGENAGYGSRQRWRILQAPTVRPPKVLRVGRRTLLNGHNANVHGGFMLRYAAIFFVIAIVAAVFGFGGIALAAAGIAKILFFVFLILFLVSLISGLGSRRHV